MKSFLIIDEWGNSRIIAKDTINDAIIEVLEEYKEKNFDPLLIVQLPQMCSGCET